MTSPPGPLGRLSVISGTGDTGPSMAVAHRERGVHEHIKGCYKNAMGFI